MKKLIKQLINTILKIIFIFIKDESKRAHIISMLSKALYDNKNTIEYDPNFKAFWLKSADQFLFMVDKPYFNYSKKIYTYLFKKYIADIIPLKLMT